MEQHPNHSVSYQNPGDEEADQVAMRARSDSRGCGAEPPVHVRHDVERSFWLRPAVNLPRGSLLSSSGVSRPDMTVRPVAKSSQTLLGFVGSLANDLVVFRMTSNPKPLDTFGNRNA